MFRFAVSIQGATSKSFPIANQALMREKELTITRVAEVPIHPVESELADRLALAIGDEPRASFARRAGVAESVLRKYLAGAQPSTDRLVAMADAAGVNIAWLAAGRGPQKGAPAAPAPATQSFSDVRRLAQAIDACEVGLAANGLVMAPDKKAELILAAYDLIGEWELPEGKVDLSAMIRAMRTT